VNRVDTINAGMDRLSALQDVQIPSLEGKVSEEEWKLRIDLAAAYRLIAHYGWRAAFDREVFERRAFFRATLVQQEPEQTRQTGRSTFFVLSAVTAGLLYFAMTKPQPVFPGTAEPVTETKRAVPDPFELPGVKPETVPMEPLPGIVVPELEVEPVRVAPEPAPVPVLERGGEREAPMVEQRPATVVRAEARPSRPPAAQEAAAPVKVSTPAPAAAPARVAAPAKATVDLKALERHQVILYNQSFLASDAARRERLMASRVAFVKRLEACSTDVCKRDTYLARNQEVAGIMAR